MNFRLPSSELRLHTTAADMDQNAILARMYGAYNERGPVFYGMGDALPAYSAVVTNGLQCPAGSRVSVNGCTDDSIGAVVPPVGFNALQWTAFLQGNSDYMNADPQYKYSASDSPAPAPAPYSGSSYMQFTLPVAYRPPNTVYPGDSWQVTINGSQPNAPVSVNGVHPDGNSATAQMGMTDAQGNFTMSGTFDSTMLGSWSETWTVGGKVPNGGNVAFTVANQPSTAPAKTSTPAPAPASTQAPAPAPATTQQATASTNLLGMSSNTLMLVAAGVGAFLLLGGRK